MHGVPIDDIALRSVHRDGVQLAHRFRRLRSSVLHRLTRPTSAPFRAGQPPVSDQLCGTHPAEVPATRFPVSCRHFGGRPSLLGSSCARWGVAPSSRSVYRRRSAGPQRGCRVAHEQDPTGQGALLIPGTVVRSRPVTVLRPAPAALLRPVPTAPLEHPIGGGDTYETPSK